MQSAGLQSLQTPVAWRWRSLRARVLIVVAATFAVFSETLSFDFLKLDDRHFLFENWAPIDTFSPSIFTEAFSRFVLGAWTPIAHLSHRFDLLFFGSDPAGHHFTSVIIHCATSALVLVFLDRFLSAGASLVVALTFALHPTRIESVAWIAERRDVLFGFFCVFAVALWSRDAVRSTVWGRVVVLVLGILAVLSKQTAIVLPLLLVLVDWLLGRCGSIRHFAVAVLRQIPLGCGGLIVVLVTLLPSGAETGLSVPTPPPTQTALVALSTYTTKFFAPLKLAFLYPRPWSWSRAELSAAAVVVTCLAAAFLMSRSRLVRSGLLWFVVVLLPALGFRDIGGPHLIADRYLYLPLLGLAWATVGWAELLLLRVAIPLKVTISSAWLAWITAFTITVLPSWKDTPSLVTRALALGYSSAQAHGLYAVHLAASHRREDLEASALHFRKSFDIEPNEDVRLELALALSRVGRWHEAKAHYEECVRVDGSRPAAHLGLARSLHVLGMDERARHHFELASRLDPDWVETHVAYAHVLAERGETDLAVAQLEQALASPEARARERLAVGFAFYELGQRDRAASEWQVVAKGVPHTHAPWAFMAWARCVEGDAAGAMHAVGELRGRAGEMPIAALLEVCVAYAQSDQVRAEQRAAALIQEFPSYRDAIDAFARDPKGDARFRMLVHVFHEAGMDEPWPGHSTVVSPPRVQDQVGP